MLYLDVDQDGVRQHTEVLTRIFSSQVKTRTGEKALV